MGPGSTEKRRFVLSSESEQLNTSDIPSLPLSSEPICNLVIILEAEKTKGQSEAIAD